MLKEQLLAYGINPEKISEVKVISEKDGMSVTAFLYEKQHYVIKCYYNKEHAREIQNYLLLNKLGLKTIKSYGYTDKSILLEDINYNESYALSTKKNLENPSSIRALAKWYKSLHVKGREYLLKNKHVNLYSEIEDLSFERIEFISRNLNYGDQEFWDNLHRVVEMSKQFVKSNRTLTYNDFSYVNLIVSKDGSDAYMFDYNLLGEGLAYFDLRNVMSGIPVEMHDLFLEEYGEYNVFEKELDVILEHLVCLNIAYQRKQFPNWALTSKEAISSESFNKSAKALLHKIDNLYNNKKMEGNL